MQYIIKEKRRGTFAGVKGVYSDVVYDKPTNQIVKQNFTAQVDVDGEMFDVYILCANLDMTAMTFWPSYSYTNNGSKDKVPEKTVKQIVDRFTEMPKEYKYLLSNGNLELEAHKGHFLEYMVIYGTATGNSNLIKYLPPFDKMSKQRFHDVIRNDELVHAEIKKYLENVKTLLTYVSDFVINEDQAEDILISGKAREYEIGGLLYV